VNDFCLYLALSRLQMGGNIQKTLSRKRLSAR
jgi:hypothetical protein